MRCTSKLYAKDSKGDIVDVDHAQSEGDYFCCFCQQQLGVRRGKYRKKHFYHINHRTKQSHNFVEHQMIQRLIQQHLQVAKAIGRSEVKITNDCRADVVWYAPEGLIIYEVQRSTLSMASLLKRVAIYRAENIRIFWIICQSSVTSASMTLHVTKWIQELLCQAQSIIIYCRQNRCFYYMYWYCKVSDTQLLVQLLSITNICETRSIWRLKQEQEQELAVGRIRIARLFHYQCDKWRQHWLKKSDRSDILKQLCYELQVDFSQVSDQVYSSKYICFSPYYHHFWLQTYLYLIIIHHNLNFLGVEAYLDTQQLRDKFPQQQQLLQYYQYVIDSKL